MMRAIIKAAKITRALKTHRAPSGLRGLRVFKAGRLESSLKIKTFPSSS
jgi:hypothetical protein